MPAYWQKSDKLSNSHKFDSQGQQAAEPQNWKRADGRGVELDGAEQF